MIESSCHLCSKPFMLDPQVVSEAQNYCSKLCLDRAKMIQMQTISGELESKRHIAKTVKFFKTLPQDGDTDFVLATQFMVPLDWVAIHKYYDLVKLVDLPDDFVWRGSEIESCYLEMKTTMTDRGEDLAMQCLGNLCEAINKIMYPDETTTR